MKKTIILLIAMLCAFASAKCVIQKNNSKTFSTEAYCDSVLFRGITIPARYIAIDKEKTAAIMDVWEGNRTGIVSYYYFRTSSILFTMYENGYKEEKQVKTDFMESVFKSIDKIIQNAEKE